MRFVFSSFLVLILSFSLRAQEPEKPNEAPKKELTAQEKQLREALGAPAAPYEDRKLPKKKSEARAFREGVDAELAKLKAVQGGESELFHVLERQRRLLQRIRELLPADGVSIEKEAEAAAAKAKDEIRSSTRRVKSWEAQLQLLTEENSPRAHFGGFQTLEDLRASLAELSPRLAEAEKEVEGARARNAEQPKFDTLQSKRREALVAAEKKLADERKAAGSDPAQLRLAVEEAWNLKLALFEVDLEERRFRAAAAIGLAELRAQVLRLHRDELKLREEVLRIRASHLQKQQLEKEARNAIEAARTNREMYRRRAIAAEPGSGEQAWNEANAAIYDLRVQSAKLRQEQQAWAGRLGSAGEIGKAEVASKALALKIEASREAERNGFPTTVGVPSTLAGLRALLKGVRARLAVVTAAQAELDGRGSELEADLAQSQRREERIRKQLRVWLPRIAKSYRDQEAELVRGDLEVEISLLQAAMGEFEARIRKFHRRCDEIRLAIVENLGYLERTLLWTREERHISLAAFRRAIADADVLWLSFEEGVRRRWALGVAALRSSASRGAWAGLYAALILVLGWFLRRRLPERLPKGGGPSSGEKPAERSPRFGGWSVWTLIGLILRRPWITFLFAALATGTALIVKIPRSMLTEIAVVVATPLAYRLLRVLSDILMGPGSQTERLLHLSDEAAARIHCMLTRLLWLAVAMVPLGLLLDAADYRDITRGFMQLWWLSYRSASYLLVLTTLLRPQVVRGVIRGEGHLAALAKTVLVLALPCLMGALIFLFALEALRYMEAARVFRIWLFECLLSALAVGVGYRLLLWWLLGGRSANRVLPRNRDDEDHEEWLRAGQRLALDRLVRSLLAILALTTLFVLISRLWPLQGAAMMNEEFAGPGSLTPKGLARALGAAILSYVALGHYRQVMEFYVLPATRLDRGLRYTVLTLSSYAFFAIAIVVVLRLLRISGNQIGWVVSALAVGIGFGLQSIVRNLVSGIILLVERPVRVGDLVRVNDEVGYVEKITIRATTVMTLDGIGVVIPNEDFIEGRVVNNSLGDPRFRVRVGFGVAYESDVSTVRKLALEVASRNHRVLKRPPPLVLFEGFGDSSLDFTLQFWIQVETVELVVCSDLRYALEAAFERAGIVIPFPQRDLHLRSLDPQLRDAVLGEGSHGESSPKSTEGETE